MQASAAMRVARALALALLTAVLGCGDGAGPQLSPRPFLMGFAPMPPRLDPAIVVPSINYWLPRADAAIMHVSPPWAALIRGVSPAAAVDTAQLPLANYFRANRLALVFTVDATDGLNRAAEAPELVALGRSVTDTAIQRLCRDWVFATTLPVLVVEGGWPSITSAPRRRRQQSRPARSPRCSSWGRPTPVRCSSSPSTISISRD